MKKLMIISLMLFTTIPCFNLHAQSISRLKEKIETQKKEVEAQKEKVAQAEKAVQDEINRGKEAAKKDPTAHSANETLEKLREDLKKEKEQLEKEEQKLKTLQEKLDKALKKFEEKLKRAMEDLLKKHPVPDKGNELDEYEKDMKKLETNPRNSKLEKALREQIQKLIDAKRKELGEQGALPGQKERGFSHPVAAWDKTAYRSSWTAGIEVSVWFPEETTFPDSYFGDIKEAVYADPLLFEKLFERLGGEFFIGSFSGPGSFTEEQQQQPIFYGLSGEYRLNRHLGFAINFSKGQSSRSAEFPVSVIQAEDGITRTETGYLEHNQKYFAASIKGKYTFGQALLRPMLGFGIGYLWQAKSEVEAVLGGERFTIGTIDPEKAMVTHAQAGLRLELQLPLTLEVAAQARRLNGETQFGVGLGMQYRFSR